MLEKTRGLSVDCVTYDLEDSVTPSRKPEARRNIRHFLQQSRPAGIKENAVRINAVQTGLALHDLTEVVRLPFQERSDFPSHHRLTSVAENAQHRHDCGSQGQLTF